MRRYDPLADADDRAVKLGTGVPLLVHQSGPFLDAAMTAKVEVQSGILYGNPANRHLLWLALLDRRTAVTFDELTSCHDSAPCSLLVALREVIRMPPH
jgi:hypothetical protein